MSFEVAADSYDRFMGRYSRHLSSQLADLAGVTAGWSVLDVGCGTGLLTAELSRRVGPSSVTAVDPSESFVEAVRERQPGATVKRAVAEQLPFPDASFDAAIAQLVVHFMSDPVAGLREMARVTRAGGAVAACVWDHSAGGQGPLTPFFAASHELDPSAPEESDRPGTRKGHLAELFGEAGIGEVEESTLTVEVEHPSFEEWWAPFELGVGPTAAFVDGLDPEQTERLRELCRNALPSGEPFVVHARAWAVRGVAGG
ncbi:MAG TPA: class I SAM-dependent methyltransferase [Gaiellaceae bacterium]|nr:class I SAM-dependent methyltransferase [Gaiellaceae bacterium]